MRTPLLAALLCAAVGSAWADEFADDLNAGAEAARARQADAQDAKSKGRKGQAAIERTLEAMYDGNEIGTAVVQYIRDNKIALTVEESLPGYPRVLAPVITAQVSGRMLSDMPASSEREYMRLSMEVRSWIELGGDKRGLPVIEPIVGYKNPAMSDRFKLWLDNGSEMTLYKIGEATRTKSVMELADAEKDPAKKKALDQANKRFVEFLLAETEWKRSNAFWR